MKLPKIETLIILVFLGCVALWAVSKCSSTRSDLVRRVRDTTDDEQEERPKRRDTVFVTQQAPAPVSQVPVNVQRPGLQSPQSYSTTPTMPTPTTATSGPPPSRPVLGNPNPAAAPATQTATSKYSTLYVTIDGLKMRKTPGLKGALVQKLELYEPVFFLNQKSEKTEEISLGYEKVTDHWVKVRTKSGQEGWVFGAGVHYYKMKRKGVLD